MDFTALHTLSGEALTAALALDFDTVDADGLAAALAERNAYAATTFAMTDPSVGHVNAVEAVVASIKAIEDEQASRETAAQDAADRFAAARTAFTAEATEEGDESEEGDEATEEDGEEDGEEGDESTEEGDSDAGDADAGDSGVTTASARNGQKIKPGSTASKVARRTTKPKRAASTPVVMTAASDVEGFGSGQRLSGMDQVAKAVMSRVKGISPYNERAAKAAYQANGQQADHRRLGTASFGLSFPEALTASGTPGAEYEAAKQAIKGHQEAMESLMVKDQTLSAAALTAAGWCAPSPIAYSYIADYVVDGLISVPEVSAPRGGLMLTTGPARKSQGTALDDFGWTQTEAEAIANTPKTFETIVCPDFQDHRLDAIGYGYEIPLLTKKAYPELVADALRFANVLYAHRANRRVISDIVALSQAVTFSGYGPSFTDALEALSLIAVAERRKWNLGENAIMEVKLPVFAKEVFRADMSRRAAVAFDSVSDGQIAKHFSDRRLAVEYVSDWQEINPTGGTLTNLVLPGSFTALIYPSGTFVKAVEDVINLSTVYDAASLTLNKYLGVFFEQGYMLVKAGYGASKVSIPINTAGEMGALTLNGLGDSLAGGSF